MSPPSLDALKRVLAMVVPAALPAVALVVIAAAPAVAQPADDEAADTHLPVYIEDSPAAQEMVAQAQQLREQGRLTDAVATLQEVIDDYGSKLMPDGDGLYAESTQWVQRRIVSDSDLLAAYRQVYGPEAERLLEAAGTPPEASTLEALFARLFLTDAGLRAGLSLAGLYLERADHAAAASVLDGLPDHPGFDGEAGRYHALAATAALLAGDAAAFERHRDRLRERGAEDRVAQVEALSRQLHPPLRVERTATAAPATPPLDAVQTPLWSVRVSDDHESQTPLPYAQRSGETYPILPVAAGDALFINEGHRIAALDRYSGRLLWAHEPSADQEVSPLVARMGRTISDRRGVLLHRDRVVGVVGQATAWPIRGEGPNASTVLVSLDRATGEMHWQITPGDLDASLAKAYFQGTPLATADRIFVLLRRNQTSGFQDAFVAAVDAATGQPLWRRHISSAVTASRYAPAAPPTMTLRDGTLYVSDNLAAVAAVVGRTGALRWARVVLEAADTNARGLTGGGEAPVDVMPPVLCQAGLVVPPLGSQSSLLVLDPQSGAERSRVPVSAGEVSYLLPAGEDVLGVGAAVTLFDGQTLQSRWTSTRRDGRSDAPRPLAAVTRDHVLAPSGDRVVVLDREDGSPVRDADLSDGGNVLALDEQIVVADSRRVRSYMAWEAAYAALARQAGEQPNHPGAGLAMAHLAATHGRPAATLEGVDLALAALHAAQLDLAMPAWSRLQTDAFTQILTFAETPALGDAAVRQQLFDRLATISSTAEQEVAYHLALGRLLEQMGEPAEAVEHYQAVLMDDTLGAQLYHGHDVARQAALEALRRLEALVTAAGRDAYARFDAEAAAKLQELTSLGAGADALIDLAHRYPLATSAPLARLQAAERLVATGRDREAAAQLRMAFRRSAEPAVAARVAGRLAELYESTGRPVQAMHWLRRVARERPDLQPLRDGRPTDASAWMADLASRESVARFGASLTLPLQSPYTLPGVLMRPALHAPDDPAPEAFVLRAAGQLRLYRGEPLTRAWSRPAPSDETRLLVAAPDQLLFWSDETGELTALDAHDGEPMWPAVSAATLLEPLGTAAEREAQRPVAQRQFMRMIDVNAPIVVRGGQVVIERSRPESGYLVAVGDGAIAVADRAGGVVGLDRQSGRVLWQKAVEIERVAGVHAADDLVVLLGTSGVGTDAQSGAVQVLDLLTGEARLPVLEDKDPPQWAGFAGDDLLLVATAEQVTAHRLSDGGVIWRVQVSGAPLTGQGWTSADTVLLSVNGDGALVLDADTGETLNRLFRQSVDGPGMTTPRLIDDGWHLLTAAAATALNGRGQTRWRDAIEADRGHLLQQFVADRYVVLLGTEEGAPPRPVDGPPQLFQLDGPDDVEVEVQPPPQDAPPPERPERPEGATPDEAAYRLYVLERATGRIVEEHPLAMPAGTLEPMRGMMLANHLVFAAGELTLVVPGAAGSAGAGR